jgi:hypothetical protein
MMTHWLKESINTQWHMAVQLAAAVVGGKDTKDISEEIWRALQPWACVVGQCCLLSTWSLP